MVGLCSRYHHVNWLKAVCVAWCTHSHIAAAAWPAAAACGRRHRRRRHRSEVNPCCRRHRHRDRSAGATRRRDRKQTNRRVFSPPALFSRAELVGRRRDGYIPSPAPEPEKRAEQAMITPRARVRRRPASSHPTPSSRRRDPSTLAIARPAVTSNTQRRRR